MSAADPINFGLQIEVDAIASTAIGGTNMAGGKANLWREPWPVCLSCSSQRLW